ncbi:hypothetical protein DOTSEDRAFT_150005 [Dothistroma septosporum NZE10]|uniref:Uncharacterized protein n=1 Tax=Dothistroma septosporum (strain NZE10 / CBS 128990) TaxID=675120 RepID=N1PS08_DOTSN|nr:hypothetical protein DOTSEDRAFT_150005 [Dothistroma septosporum NZE10]
MATWWNELDEIRRRNTLPCVSGGTLSLFSLPSEVGRLVCQHPGLRSSSGHSQSGPAWTNAVQNKDYRYTQSFPNVLCSANNRRIHHSAARARIAMQSCRDRLHSSAAQSTSTQSQCPRYDDQSQSAGRPPIIRSRIIFWSRPRGHSKSYCTSWVPIVAESSCPSVLQLS